VLDTIESLFAGLPNLAVLRAELRRLFAWLKARGVTVVLTGERGEGQLTRQGLEEYVSDCVVFLDHRVKDQVSTRRLRVVKYRGSGHGTNEYPFLIEADGLSVLPITSRAHQVAVSNERISSGVPGLDEMLGGGGFYRGSSVLLSGTAGTGKTTLASMFAASVCRTGDRCLYFAFEEAPDEMIRNMRSVGLDLGSPSAKKKLRFVSARPAVLGLETHLSVMHRLIDEFRPAAIVVDPLTSLVAAGDAQDVEEMALRLMDFVKARGITGLYTSLTRGGTALESTEFAISSLMDTWLFVRDIEHAGERNRGIYVLKSRGTAHSNQIREFIISGAGIDLLPAHTSADGILTGSARIEREERERIQELEHLAEIERRGAELARRRSSLEAQIAALQGELEAEEKALAALTRVESARRARLAAHRRTMEQSRGTGTRGTPATGNVGGGRKARRDGKGRGAST
jgi:circadian clock protein KaiC